MKGASWERGGRRDDGHLTTGCSTHLGRAMWVECTSERPERLAESFWGRMAVGHSRAKVAGADDFPRQCNTGGRVPRSPTWLSRGRRRSNPKAALHKRVVEDGKLFISESRKKGVLSSPSSTHGEGFKANEDERRREERYAKGVSGAGSADLDHKDRERKSKDHDSDRRENQSTPSKEKAIRIRSGERRSQSFGGRARRG